MRACSRSSGSRENARGGQGGRGGGPAGAQVWAVHPKPRTSSASYSSSDLRSYSSEQRTRGLGRGGEW
eukprot:7199474-Prymnesium_polylepis.1